MAKETLEVPEKNQDQFTYVEVVKHLVEQKKAEFAALQGKINQYKTQLAALEQRLITLESEHKQKLLLDRQNFEKERQQKTNELTNRFSDLQKGEADLVRRKIELEERETRVENLKVEKQALLDERVKYENLNRQSQLKFEEANNLFGEAVDKENTASKLEDESNRKLMEVENAQSIIDKQKEDLVIKETDIKKQIDNLVTLRKEITPKIEELNKLIAEDNAKLKELAQKEQEIKDRIEEDNKLIEIVNEKEKRLQKRELDASTKEQELLRKEIVIENL